MPRGRRHKLFPARLPPITPGGRVRTKHFRSRELAEEVAAAAWADFERARRAHEATVPPRLNARYRKCNTTEQGFISWGFDRDLRIHRGGWPDFFTESRRGGLAGVEVKRHAADPLSASQIKCFQLLNQAGSPVYVWTPKGKLVPWTDHANGVAGGERRCSSGRASHELENGGQGDARPADANPTADDRISEVLTHPDDALIH
jgi:hypothetical protein